MRIENKISLPYIIWNKILNNEPVQIQTRGADTGGRSVIAAPLDGHKHGVRRCFPGDGDIELISLIHALPRDIPIRLEMPTEGLRQQGVSALEAHTTGINQDA